MVWVRSRASGASTPHAECEPPGPAGRRVVEQHGSGAVEEVIDADRQLHGRAGDRDASRDLQVGHGERSQRIEVASRDRPPSPDVAIAKRAAEPERRSGQGCVRGVPRAVGDLAREDRPAILDRDIAHAASEREVRYREVDGRAQLGAAAPDVVVVGAPHEAEVREPEDHPVDIRPKQRDRPARRGAAQPEGVGGELGLPVVPHPLGLQSRVGLRQDTRLEELIRERRRSEGHRPRELNVAPGTGRLTPSEGDQWVAARWSS